MIGQVLVVLCLLATFVSSLEVIEWWYELRFLFTKPSGTVFWVALSTSSTSADSGLPSLSTLPSATCEAGGPAISGRVTAAVALTVGSSNSYVGWRAHVCRVSATTGVWEEVDVSVRFLGESGSTVRFATESGAWNSLAKNREVGVADFSVYAGSGGVLWTDDTAAHHWNGGSGKVSLLPAARLNDVRYWQLVSHYQTVGEVTGDGRSFVWGVGASGQLGRGTTKNIGDDELPSSLGPLSFGGLSVLQIATGRYHTCVLLKETQTVRCWGSNTYGQLGYPGESSLSAPSSKDVQLGAKVQSIDAGSSHTCAVLVTKAVVCWGYGGNGRLGYNEVEDVGDDETPASKGTVVVGGDVEAVSCGASHTCALLTTKRVRCWGLGSSGRLGYYPSTQYIGDDEHPATAGDVDVGEDVVQIAAGHAHTCVLTSKSSVRCWGQYLSGRLGYGNNPKAVPRVAGDVPVGEPVRQVQAGYDHTCAILASFRVRCWGDSSEGELGLGSTKSIGLNSIPADFGPVDTPGTGTGIGADVVHLALGTHITCVMFRSRQTACWGSGEYGALGYGNVRTIGDNEAPSLAGSYLLAALPVRSTVLDMSVPLLSPLVVPCSLSVTATASGNSLVALPAESSQPDCFPVSWPASRVYISTTQCTVRGLARFGPSNCQIDPNIIDWWKWPVVTTAAGSVTTPGVVTVTGTLALVAAGAFRIRPDGASGSFSGCAWQNVGRVDCGFCSAWEQWQIVHANSSAVVKSFAIDNVEQSSISRVEPVAISAEFGGEITVFGNLAKGINITVGQFHCQTTNESCFQTQCRLPPLGTGIFILSATVRGNPIPTNGLSVRGVVVGIGDSSQRALLPSTNSIQVPFLDLVLTGTTSSEVVKVDVGGVDCPIIRPLSTLELRCGPFFTPPVWTSPAVTIYLSSGTEAPTIGVVDLLPPPRISNLTSSEWPTQGEVMIDVFGEGLGRDLGDLRRVCVVDNCVEARSKLRYISSTHIRASLPPGAGRDQKLGLETLGGLWVESEISFDYDPPIVTKVYPDRLLRGPTSPVWICGKNLGVKGRTITASVGGLTCTGPRIEVFNPTRENECIFCRANAPMGWPEQLPVMVSIAGIENAVTLGIAQGDTEVLTVSSLSRASAFSGDTVTVYGSGFGSNPKLSSVWIGGVKCRETTWLTSQSLDCVVPEFDFEKRTQPVTVRTEAGVQSTSTSFRTELETGTPPPRRVATDVCLDHHSEDPEKLRIRWNYKDAETDAGVLAKNFKFRFVTLDLYEVGTYEISRTSAFQGNGTKYQMIISPPSKYPIRVQVVPLNPLNGNWSELSNETPPWCSEKQYLDARDLICMNCPNGSQCAGGHEHDVVASSGYWRYSESRNGPEFVKCKHQPACLGVSEQDKYSVLWPSEGTCTGYPTIQFNATEGCAPGYEGTLCASCSNGFARVGIAECAPCAAPGEQAGYFLLYVIICNVFVIIFLLYNDFNSSRPRAPDTHNSTTAALKIIITHVQMIPLIGGIRVPWPMYARSFFQVTEYVSVTPTQISAECWSENLRDVFLRYGLILYVGPLILALFILGFWSCPFVRYWDDFLPANRLPANSNGPVSVWKLRVLSSLLALGMTVYVDTTKIAFRLLACEDIGSKQPNDEQYRMSLDLDLQCWESSVALPRILLASIHIILFSLAFPVFVGYKLYSVRENNPRPYEWNFAGGGLHKEYVFWEPLAMLRKGMLAAVVVFFASDSGYQIFFIGFILFLFVILHSYNKPYLDWWINFLETLSLSVTAFHAFIAMVIKDKAEIDSNIFTVLMILFHSVFLCGAIAYMLHDKNFQAIMQRQQQRQR